MLEKLKANKGKLIGHFGAALIGAVLSGVLASFLGETLGYSYFLVYLYAMFVHGHVVTFLDKKVR